MWESSLYIYKSVCDCNNLQEYQVDLAGHNVLCVQYCPTVWDGKGGGEGEWEGGGRDGGKEGMKEGGKEGRKGRARLVNRFLSVIRRKEVSNSFGARVYFMYHYWGKLEQAPHWWDVHVRPYVCIEWHHAYTHMRIQMIAIKWNVLP